MSKKSLDRERMMYTSGFFSQNIPLFSTDDFFLRGIFAQVELADLTDMEGIPRRNLARDQHLLKPNVSSQTKKVFCNECQDQIERFVENIPPDFHLSGVVCTKPSASAQIREAHFIIFQSKEKPRIVKRLRRDTDMVHSAACQSINFLIQERKQPFARPFIAVISPPSEKACVVW